VFYGVAPLCQQLPRQGQSIHPSGDFMKKLLSFGFAPLMGFILSACVAVAQSPAPASGITAKASKYSVAETIDRLEKIAKAKGITIFARVDHSGEAEKAGLKMRPTQLLIMGNPKAGTPVMVAAPTAAIDLPLKALAWEDANGKVWLGYNNGDYLKQRHNIPDDLVKNVGAIAGLVDAALE
jgi:uncharacterized protein (DUF302 family)